MHKSSKKSECLSFHWIVSMSCALLGRQLVEALRRATNLGPGYIGRNVKFKPLLLYGQALQTSASTILSECPRLINKTHDPSSDHFLSKSICFVRPILFSSDSLRSICSGSVHFSLLHSFYFKMQETEQIQCKTRRNQTFCSLVHPLFAAWTIYCWWKREIF